RDQLDQLPSEPNCRLIAQRRVAHREANEAEIEVGLQRLGRLRWRQRARGPTPVRRHVLQRAGGILLALDEQERRPDRPLDGRWIAPDLFAVLPQEVRLAQQRVGW